MVKEYSLKKDGDTLLTKNFKIREFRCRDGSDKILIDTDLIKLIQKLRDHLGKPIVITSGYRTESHNKAVGGATNSLHKLGKASDIFCNGVDARDIAKWFYENGAKGIGLYINRAQEFVHVDTRDTKYYWIQDGSNTKQVDKF